MLKVAYGSCVVLALKYEMTCERVETTGELVEMSRNDW